MRIWQRRSIDSRLPPLTTIDTFSLNGFLCTWESQIILNISLGIFYNDDYVHYQEPSQRRDRTVSRSEFQTYRKGRRKYIYIFNLEYFLDPIYLLGQRC